MKENEAKTPGIRVDLVPFAACPELDVRVAVDVHDALWTLTYRILGTVRDLVIEIAHPPCRSDGLWKHTCLELFASSPTRPGYVELNVSPSGAWNAYRFDAYREGMRPVESAVAPVPTIRDVGADLAVFALEVDLASLGLHPPLDLGPAVVLEHQDHSLSHWAASHPPDRPDFHDPSTRTLEVDG